jgi:hypothetical protein
MHHGLIAATATEVRLLAGLERFAGDFIPSGAVPGGAVPGESVPGGAVPSPYDVGLATDDDGWVLAIGERDGRAFVLDTSMVLSTAADMIVSLSAELGVVVGGGAETVSGSYWLTAARDGRLLRFVFVQHAGMTRGMAIGDDLPSEAEHPIEDLDGGGLFAALVHLGLDATDWLADGPATALRYTASRFPDDGPITRLQSEHYERYKRPEGEWLSEITAVVREPPPP